MSGSGYPDDQLAVDNATSQYELLSQLQLLRKHRDMSQSDVATFLGKERSQIGKLESGATNPTISTIEDYAEAVGGYLVRIAVPKKCRSEWIAIVQRATDKLSKRMWLEGREVLDKYEESIKRISAVTRWEDTMEYEEETLNEDILDLPTQVTYGKEAIL